MLALHAALECGTPANAGRSHQSADALVPDNWQPREDPTDNAKWRAFQKTLMAEADEYEPAGAGQAAGLVLFGDSITERLRGTRLNEPKSEALEDDLPEVARTMISARWPTYQLHGISGDKAKPDLLRLALATIVILVALRMLFGLSIQPDEVYSVVNL